MAKRRLKLTKEDTEWAHTVKDRDGWACVICGNSNRPNAHHIIPRENKFTKYKVENGISLCPNHHMFSRQISAHNNPLAFFMWMEARRLSQLKLLKEIIGNPLLY